MTDSSPIADQRALRDLLDRYCYAIDRGEAAIFRSCWALDAQYEMNNQGSVWQSLTGQEEIVAFFDARYFSNPNRRATNHAISHANLVITGETATGDATAIVHVLDGPADDGRMMVRAIRYIDRYVRGADGWRILQRRHLPMWQYNVSTVPASIAPQPT